eukprot:48233_1
MALLFSLLQLFIITSAEPIQIETNYGWIKGKYTHNNNVREFLSVPYASPPIGNLRFALPHPHTPWNNTYDATIPPWGCPQHCNDNGVKGVCPSVTKEDCLILNIFAPNNNNKTTSYPVLIYIHGGGFTYGYGYGPRLNASRVVNFTRNVIIVLINYRLSTLGTIYDESMQLYGNQLYYDQLMAFEWIYENIAAFNGDKNNIIIYGQSAGAISVGFHLMNQNNTIIKGGIMESNVPAYINQTPHSWGNFGKALATKLGCNNTDPMQQLQCLRSPNITGDMLIQAQGSAMGASNATLHNFTPTVKTDLFVQQPLFAIQNGSFNKNVSLIVGSVANEYNLYYGDGETQTPEQFKQLWTQRLGSEIANKVINYYNVPMSPNDINVVNYSWAVQTDSYIRCPSRNMTREISIQGNKNVHVYFYHLNYAAANVNQYETFPQHSLCWNYACHTSDLWFVFDPDLDNIGPGNITYNSSEILLLKQFESYWTNFAFEDNNPNIGPNTKYLSVNWTSYDVQTKNGLIFDIGINMKVVSNIDDDPCDFWDKQNYVWMNIA